ncbi:MAG TPA: ATP-dependent helicase HrpB [Symbiobacteriaceae bacterium]|nr:ATP-dependent helicase HrpB [Symbiobacteriaceae bacterium]
MIATLPIEPVLPALQENLRTGTNAVLVAPPGAGKTTRVPLALLEEPWLAGRQILMLEPRRLAARAAARYMAASLGEQVGETVGFRVRLETRVGPKTRIEVITEGVLTRLLQEDPALERAGIVIFDEFHERSLHADLGLALCLQSQALLRADLRLLVMSATLDTQPVAALLGDVPIISSEGRSYPVETRYLEQRNQGRVETAMVRAIEQALRTEAGDVLAFLPGAGEIRRVQEGLPATPGVSVLPLHGTLSSEEQDRAIQPAATARKVVLATSIAETSLTVEGVRVVIDSGLSRVPRFSPRTGMTRLETVPVSRASADQRRGRAGRLGPGVCYRLWTEAEDRQLVVRSTPEILEADLAPLALELAAWGVTDAAELSWLDPPPLAALTQARDLLMQLGALHPNGTITPHGRQMAELGLHPRLAHMILAAVPLDLGGLACELAALLGERDILRGEADADLRHRVEALRRAPGEVRRVALEATHLKRSFQIAPHQKQDPDATGLLLAFAYPDRIAVRRSTGRFLLRNGRGAAFGEIQALSDAEYLVAADLGDQGAESRIYLAAPISLSDLQEHFAGQITEERLVAWDPAVQAVRGRRRTRLGACTLREGPLADPDPEETLRALLDGIRKEGPAILPWTKQARQLQERLLFMHHQDPTTWPDASDEALITGIDDWLAPHLYGMRSRDDLQRLRLAEILEERLTREQRRELEAQAPTHIAVPSGSRIPVDYSDPANPVLAVRLQEMFGLPETPRIGRGRIPLTLHLLSPAHRPVQVTQDLASFWRTGYFEVRKDLRGRYPKHYWPEDPWNATPTNRTRPRP